MKKKISLPVSFAAVWILVRLIIFNLGVDSQIKIGFFINILFIITLIIASLHLKVKAEKKLEVFAVNFKNSLKNAGTYIIIVIGFIFIFHQFINPNYLSDFHEKAMEIEQARDFEKLLSSPMYKGFTKEEYLEKAESTSLMFTSKKIITTFYFLGLFMMSLIFSILIPLFYKKVVLRM